MITQRTQRIDAVAGLSLAQIPEAVAKIAAMRASGASQTVIACSLGTTQQSVSTALKADSVRQRIEQAQAAMIDRALDQSIDSIVDVIQSYPTFKADKDTGMCALALKYSAETLRSFGLLPTNAHSLILNVGNESLSPAVAAVLQQLGARLAGEDNSQAIDAEVVTDCDAGCELPRETATRETIGGPPNSSGCDD